MNTLATAPDTSRPDGAAAVLRSAGAVRERAHLLLQRTRAGDSAWFTVPDDALPQAAAEVAAVTRNRFPHLEIPYHSRWRHFEAGGVDRAGDLDPQLPTDPAARARTRIDLAVVSVLLDAGAGPQWRYREGDRWYTRSEGLAVASLHAFTSGLFSGDADEPLRVDAAGLRGLTAPRLAEAFQVSPANPLLGLDGRVALLRRLGDVLADQSEVFGADGRPGGLFDALTGTGGRLSAPVLLSQLLTSLGSIWLAGNVIGDEPLGDCWRHAAVPGPGLTAGWMPFHKLSQWLTYSLLEPFEWAGVPVDDVDALTGLPEYRNGGLLLDTGVLALREPAWAGETWQPGAELVVEWRALTVALLDELADLVRAELGAAAMPLACILEGGTWAAGRALAGRLRDGLPPLHVDSDGTVF